MVVKKKMSELEIGGILKPKTSLENKTGSWRDKKPVWDSSKCIHCMLCVTACPEECIKTQKKEGKIERTETDFDYCKGCGLCANVCPVKAIKMEKE